jgi:hypothetical protein
MKQIILSSLLLTTLFFTGINQSSAQPAGYKAGTITTDDGTKKEGFIKENFKGKASLQFQSADGKKTIYSGADIKEVSIEGVVYITYRSDFFKVIKSGDKVSLVQKSSDASGKLLYNGADVVGVSTGTEGAINDLLVRKSGEQMLVLVTKKNIETVLNEKFSDCSVLAESIKNKKISYEEIEKIVQQYNDCK